MEKGAGSKSGLERLGASEQKRDRVIAGGLMVFVCMGTGFRGEVVIARYSLRRKSGPRFKVLENLTLGNVFRAPNRGITFQTVNRFGSMFCGRMCTLLFPMFPVGSARERIAIQCSVRSV